MLDGIAVITDNVNMTTDTESSQWYESKAWPTLIATNDYYPFGMAMNGRTSQLAETNAYRYGFNGKELDNFGELSQLEIETVDLSTALVFEMAINATLQTSNTNLIVTNTGGAYVTDRNGANDGAFKLNGTNDYIKVNDAPELEVGVSDFTIGGWVKKNANTSGSDNNMFVTKWNTGASPGTNSWILSVGKKSVGNVVRFYYEEGTDKYEFVSTLKLNANEWYHVVARRTGSLLEVLVNSEVWISEDIGAAQFNDVNIPMYIGALGGALSSTYNSNITVDDIRLFKRAISTSELNAWQNGANESTLNNPSNNAATLASNNHYDYGFRIYNPRIAKFLSVDPLTSSYPWYTPYQFAGNKPIMADDVDGLEERIRIYNSTNDGKVVTTIYDSRTLTKSVQMSGSYAMYNEISQEEWISLKTATWQGFSGNEDLFASGYKQYTVGMEGRTDTNFTGLNKGTLTIGAESNGNVLVFDPNDRGTNSEIDWSLYGKALKTFNPIYPVSDPSVEGSEKFSSTVRNVQSAAGVVLTLLAAISGSGLIGIGAKASVLGGLDDLSGTLNSDGQTVIQNALGTQTGNAVKTGLNVLGAAGSATSIYKGGVNTSDVISGTLDVKSAVERTVDK